MGELEAKTDGQLSNVYLVNSESEAGLIWVHTFFAVMMLKLYEHMIMLSTFAASINRHKLSKDTCHSKP